MGSHEDFTRYWTQAQPVVARYVNSIVPDFNQAEDVLQEVAVVLLRRFDEYDPSRPFAAWALGIARNKILALHRARPLSCLGDCPDILEAAASACEELAPEMEARRRALRECVGEVHGRAFKLLSLRYEQSLKPQEIARRLGMAAGAVRVALLRLRDTLQDCVERRLVGQGGA